MTILQRLDGDNFCVVVDKPIDESVLNALVFIYDNSHQEMSHFEILKNSLKADFVIEQAKKSGLAGDNSGANSHVFFKIDVDLSPNITCTASHGEASARRPL